MNRIIHLAASIVTLFFASNSCAEMSFAQQNELLFEQLKDVHKLSETQMKDIRSIFSRSGFIGQGNPAIARHPATPEQCESKLKRESLDYADKESEIICGAKYMAPLYDPTTQKPQDAKACIDQFEFPNIPCTYPVTWIRASEAAQVCNAMGKRLCDAHEWEGACAGALQPPDYRFDLAKGVAPNTGINRMRKAHNATHAPDKIWSYGPTYRKGVCAANSSKSPGCAGGGWNKCGTNSYPTGYFPGCKSTLGVYDLNGNAAEHMNLPLSKEQMASSGSKRLGYTEMKGSWFIFDKYRAHEDWCRWRAPYWHGSRVMDTSSHSNYHLGFRCCKSLE